MLGTYPGCDKPQSVGEARVAFSEEAGMPEVSSEGAQVTH